MNFLIVQYFSFRIFLVFQNYFFSIFKKKINGGFDVNLTKKTNIQIW